MLLDERDAIAEEPINNLQVTWASNAITVLHACTSGPAHLSRTPSTSRSVFEIATYLRLELEQV